MKIYSFLAALFFVCVLSAQPAKYVYKDIRFKAVNHATFQMWYAGKYYLVDPSVDSGALQPLSNPDYIVYTDIHFDHLNIDNLNKLQLKPTTIIIAPVAVKKEIEEKLPGRKFNIRILENGATVSIGNVAVDAVPMYNLTPDRLQFHTKGRGNGYVFHFGKSTVYISGDTEDIPEMRALKNIDVAFVCMNLPYTMDIKQAESAVLAFKPKVVIPYHYRGKSGMSDVGSFTKEVQTANPNIKVVLLKWYSSNE